MSGAAASPDTSLRFSSLPVELRLKIWEFSTPDYGVVIVNFSNDSIKDAHTRQPHPLTATCSESRTIFLRRFPDILPLEDSPRRVAVNFVHDFFYLRGFQSRTREVLLYTTLLKLQNIVTDSGDFPLQDAFAFLTKLQRLWV